MAAGVVLKCVYADAEGNNVTHTWKYVDPQVEETAVRALVNGTITNGSIFAKVPIAARSATVVTTSEREIELPSQ